MSSKGKSIFHTILLSMLLVLGVEFVLSICHLVPYPCQGAVK